MVTVDMVRGDLLLNTIEDCDRLSNVCKALRCVQGY